MSGIKLKGSSSRSRAKASTARWVLWLFAVLLGLLIVAYFTITSSVFIKRFILPRVGNSLRAELTADTVSVSPFSKLEITNLKLTPNGQETLLTGGRLRARYSLIAILRGRLEISEAFVDSATINLVQTPDGKSNLDPLLADRAKKPAAKTASSAPLQVDIKSIQLTNVTLRQTQQRVGAGPDVFEISQFNLAATDIRNGSTGKLDFTALLGLDKPATTNTAAAKLAAQLRGGFSFTLNDALKPTELQGESEFAVSQGQGEFADLANVAAKLTADATPTQIKELALAFTQAGARVGGVRVSGPFDAAKREGKLNLEVSGIDRRVLNLAGATAGMDFGTTTINTTNEIELAKGGAVISIFGDLRVGQFQMLRAGEATPKLDIIGDYSIAVDQTKMSALIGSFKLNGTQGGRSVLTAGLSSPMTITWGKAGDTAGTSTLNFAMTDLALENWKPLFGQVLPTGKARLEGKIATRDDGKIVNYEFRVHADSVTARLNTQRIDGLTFTFDAVGEARELRQFKVTEYGAQIFHAGQPAFSFQGAAGYDRTTATVDAEISMLGALPQLSGMFGMKTLDFSSGVLEMRGIALQSPRTNSFMGKLRLVDLTGRLGTTPFEHFGTDVDMELLLDAARLQIRKATGTFTENSKAGGKLNLTGNYVLATGAADLALRLDGVNQNGLRPFLEPWFEGKKLTTVALQATAAIAVKADGATTIKADAALTNLTATVIRTGKPTQPVNVRFQLDTTVNKESAQLRQCLLTVTPTEKVKNQITITGDVSFPKTNKISGALKLAADTLDLTRVYDLISGPAQAQASPPATTASSGGPLPVVEPAAMPPQFDNLTAEVAINRLVIREMTAEKISARARLDGSELVLKPCFVSINGAPVKAAVTLDLGVPGYRYDVSFDAQAVPLAPLVNTFQPERRGHLAGTFTGSVAVKGEGMTGANLQKNLTGQITTLVTNVNLSLGNTRTPVIRALLDTVIGIPELIRNPVASVENLLGRFVNFGGQRGGWSDNLMNAPIEVIETKIQAGEGKIRLEQAEVRSAAFRARAAGDIVLAPILTNSTLNIPVTLSLNRPLASQIGLVPEDAPTNALYYAMPQFLEIEGTLGKPKTKTDKLVIAELAARSSAGMVKGIGSATGEKVGNVLQKSGSFLGGILGGKSSTNAPANTATNKGPFDLFK